jgi:hypothetical protein
MVNSNRYTASATIKALRGIFEENGDKPFEVRWALAKSSETYRGFKIRCSASAVVLLAATIPLLLVSLLVNGSTIANEHTTPTICLAVLYLATSGFVSWRLGIKVAEKMMSERPRRPV